MKIAVTFDGRQYDVWAMLNDDAEPHKRSESFIIGTGETFLDAMRDASQELKEVLNQQLADFRKENTIRIGRIDV